jgi:hypothetical protein
MPRQFANDSMTPGPISVSRDQYKNEIPSDQPNHTDTTAGEGAFNWNGEQYSRDFNAGFGSYGVSVDASSPSVEKVSVDTSRADRGKDS